MEPDVLERVTNSLNQSAQKLIENDCASLNRIKSLKEWHEADYILCSAREFNGISKEQYDSAVLIFTEWWKKTTGRSVIRAFSELHVSELTGITEQQRSDLQESESRLEALLKRQSELIDRYRAGDRSDGLFREFLDVNSELSFSALISYTEDYNRQISEILREAAVRRRQKTN